MGIGLRCRRMAHGVRNHKGFALRHGPMKARCCGSPQVYKKMSGEYEAFDMEVGTGSC